VLSERGTDRAGLLGSSDPARPCAKIAADRHGAAGYRGSDQTLGHGGVLAMQIRHANHGHSRGAGTEGGRPATAEDHQVQQGQQDRKPGHPLKIDRQVHDENAR